MPTSPKAAACTNRQLGPRLKSMDIVNASTTAKSLPNSWASIHCEKDEVPGLERITPRSHLHEREKYLRPSEAGQDRARPHMWWLAHECVRRFQAVSRSRVKQWCVGRTATPR